MQQSDQFKLGPKFSQIEEDFYNIQTFKDMRFGIITLMQCKQDPSIIIMKKENLTQEFQQAIQYFQDLEIRKSFNCPNLLQMPDYSLHIIQQDKEDNHFYFNSFFEYPEWDLEKEIKKRAEIKQRFSSEELLVLFEDILNSLVYLQNNKLIHGDINPSFISMHTQYQPFKLCDRLNSLIYPHQLQLEKIIDENSLYMCPLLFRCLINNKKTIKYNPYKSEVFSFGLILLQASLLHSIQSIYDIEQREFNEQNFQYYFEEFLSIYNDDLLRELMIKMLQLKEDLRYSPITLQKFYIKLKEEIQNNSMEEMALEDSEKINEESNESESDIQLQKTQKHLRQESQNNYSFQPYKVGNDVTEDFMNSRIKSKQFQQENLEWVANNPYFQEEEQSFDRISSYGNYQKIPIKRKQQNFENQNQNAVLSPGAKKKFSFDLPEQNEKSEDLFSREDKADELASKTQSKFQSLENLHKDTESVDPEIHIQVIDSEDMDALYDTDKLQFNHKEEIVQEEIFPPIIQHRNSFEIIKEKQIEIPIEKIKEKQIEIPIEKIKEKQFEIPIEKIKEKQIEIPIERIQEVKPFEIQNPVQESRHFIRQQPKRCFKLAEINENSFKHIYQYNQFLKVENLLFLNRQQQFQ